MTHWGSSGSKFSEKWDFGWFDGFRMQWTCFLLDLNATVWHRVPPNHDGSYRISQKPNRWLTGDLPVFQFPNSLHTYWVEQMRIWRCPFVMHTIKKPRSDVSCIKYLIITMWGIVFLSLFPHPLVKVPSVGPLFIIMKPYCYKYIQTVPYG